MKVTACKLGALGYYFTTGKDVLKVPLLVNPCIRDFC